MNGSLNPRRIVETGALLLIGDGIMGMLKPRWHSLLWDTGPAPVRHSMEYLARHRTTARALYTVEILIGLLLASRQTPER